MSSRLASGSVMTARILVVDDMPAIRRSLRAFLEQEADWMICEAENGKAALDRVQEIHPDVVVMDLSMPVMNGIDAARAIKAIAPSTRIIMLTLHAYPHLADEARKVGITKVLSKASTQGSEVVHAVRSLLA